MAKDTAMIQICQDISRSNIEISSPMVFFGPVRAGCGWICLGMEVPEEGASPSSGVSGRSTGICGRSTLRRGRSAAVAARSTRPVDPSTLPVGRSPRSVARASRLVDRSTGAVARSTESVFQDFPAWRSSGLDSPPTSTATSRRGTPSDVGRARRSAGKEDSPQRHREHRGRHGLLVRSGSARRDRTRRAASERSSPSAADRSCACSP